MQNRTGLTSFQQIDDMLTQLNDEAEGKELLRNKRGKLRKITGTVVFILLTLFLLTIIASIYIDKLNNRIPSVFGYSFLKVESASMEPTLMTGDIILVKKSNNPESLKEGTVVCFYLKDGRVVTHRIIEIVNEDNNISYVTKGDNIINSPDDELLTPDRVIGTLVLNLSHSM
ncbi:MAG: signal peptidase I [Clostridiales bacterium]|nr:MAG: signal peptidase I [Clostridiales bacterium]